VPAEIVGMGVSCVCVCASACACACVRAWVRAQPTFRPGEVPKSYAGAALAARRFVQFPSANMPEAMAALSNEVCCASRVLRLLPTGMC
jgi:hypothetical protein